MTRTHVSLLALDVVDGNWVIVSQSVKYITRFINHNINNRAGIIQLKCQNKKINIALLLKIIKISHPPTFRNSGRITLSKDLLWLIWRMTWTWTTYGSTALVDPARLRLVKQFIETTILKCVSKVSRTHSSRHEDTAILGTHNFEHADIIWTDR